MSLYGALFSGVSGLQSQSSAMGAISDNVSNVNTVGYKGTKVHFKTLVTAQVSVTQYSPGGVQSAPRMNVDIQGLLQATTSSTDMGLSGQGFFVVSDQGENPSGFAYTRAGSFKVDKQGYLQNVAGYYLQGWPLTTWDGKATASTVDVDGTTYMKSYKNPENGSTFYINDNVVSDIHMQPLNLSTIGGTARPSASLSLGANLPADSDVGNTEKTNALIFDSLGNSHNLLYTWSKRDQNEWDVEVVPPEGSTYITLDDQTQARNTYFSAGRLDFTAVPASGTDFTLDFGAGAVTFEFSDTTERKIVTNGTNQTTLTNPGHASDSITIDGETFVLRTDPALVTTDLDVDISSSASAADTAEAMASVIQAKFTDKYGVGYYAEANGADLIAFDPIGITTDPVATFGVPAASPAGNYSIDISGKSLSQVLDELGAQVNTAASLAYGQIAKSTPDSWANRVAGENAIIFRNGDTTNGITVASTDDLLDTNGLTAVIQNDPDGFTVPALAGGVAWTNTNNNAIVFNGDGSIDTIFGKDEAEANDPKTQISIGWANGALNMDGSNVDSGGSPAISLFLGNYNEVDGLQQLSGDYQLNYISQDGNRFGNYSGISVSENGVVTALFDNGVQTPIFMIPIATFVNPNGMNAITGNVFQQTDVSGLPVVREAGSAGAGTVSQATLEASTVDLGEEFTTMITTQRAYSAAAKIITTSDDMLEELIRIKR